MRHSPILAHIPEIQLAQSSITGYRSRFTARQKSDVEERISTLEAIALLMKELSASQSTQSPTPVTYDGWGEAAEILLSNLDIVMEHLLLQSGMKGIKTNSKRAQ